ncbi:MAG: lipase family protein [Synechococcales bacterium]|nr:lipase family protein [Synechococcales bacterium]
MKNFQPTATAYNGHNALVLAQASHLAYRDRAEIQLQAAQWGFPTFHWFDQETTQGYLIANDQAIILVFRGTEMRNLRDWLTNSQVGKRSLLSTSKRPKRIRRKLVPSPTAQHPSSSNPSACESTDGATRHSTHHSVESCLVSDRPTDHPSPAPGQRYSIHRRDRIAQSRVHQGFWNALQSVWSEIRTALATVRDRQQPLYITGHSLGGALAILAAAQFAQAGEPIQAVYTYGAPRVGNRSFQQQFNAQLQDRTFRLVNDADIVPRLPAVTLGYIHTGQVFHFNAIGTLQLYCDRKNQRLRRLGRGLLRWLDGDLEEVRDHSITAYETRLRNALPSLSLTE